MTLAARRAAVPAAQDRGGGELAVALIDLAEAEPVFGHRQPVLRALLEQAAGLLDALDGPDARALQGRVLLRLAHVKLSEFDLEGVEQLAGRARDRLEATGDAERVAEAGILVARAGIRRHGFSAAEAQLVALSDRLSEPSGTPTGRRVVAMLGLAWAELALEQKQFTEAASRLAVLAASFDESSESSASDELVEPAYACHQAQAAAGFGVGDLALAIRALRDALAIARGVGALPDELECRVALAGALAQRGDPVGRDEAARHLQITRDQAIEHRLDAMHIAALMGQAGLLAQSGKTQAALSRCIEIGNVAVASGNLPQYAAAVALMSQIYEQKGDLASAYRTFAEAHASLREKLGEDAKDVIRPHLTAFADRIGHARFAEIARAVNKAAHARQTFRHRS